MGSLQDTVPTDRIVVLRESWGVFRKGSSGEILLRLTYKAYVEDEEDDRHTLESLDTDASDDESDTDESISSFEQMGKISSSEADRESFMDVLAALIVSEEFQGIVASETATARAQDGGSNASLPVSAQNAESLPSNSDGNTGGLGGICS